MNRIFMNKRQIVLFIKFHACSDETLYKQTMINKVFLYAILRAET